MGTVAALAVVLVAYNTALNLLDVPGWAYVPANLTLAALGVVIALRRGVGWDGLGLSGEAVWPGLTWGGAIVALVALGLLAAQVVPAAESLLSDRRVSGVAGVELVYRTLLRIPFGTAIPEEVLFRGVLIGLIARERSLLAAVVGSSVVFGLWHIGPAIELLRANRPGAGLAWTTLFVTGAVVGTAAGGAALGWLRVRTDGLVAPVLVHTAANSLGTLAAVAFQARRA